MVKYYMNIEGVKMKGIFRKELKRALNIAPWRYMILILIAIVIRALLLIIPVILVIPLIILRLRIMMLLLCFWYSY